MVQTAYDLCQPSMIIITFPAKLGSSFFSSPWAFYRSVIADVKVVKTQSEPIPSYFPMSSPGEDIKCDHTYCINKQNNNFACASSFFVHFFAVVARLPSKLPNFTCYGDRYPQGWGNCRKLRNRIKNKVETTKASCYHNSFIQSKGNAPRTWKTINNLMSRRQNQIVKDVNVNDISICNTKEISNALNEHFSTIGPRLAPEIPLTSDEESIHLNKFLKITTNSVFVQLLPVMSLPI